MMLEIIAGEMVQKAMGKGFKAGDDAIIINEVYSDVLKGVYKDYDFSIWRSDNMHLVSFGGA